MVYTLDVYQRSNPSDQWDYVRSISERNTGNFIIRTEDNLVFNILPLPFKAGDRWNPASFDPQDIELAFNGQTIQPFYWWNEAIVESLDHQAHTADGTLYETVAEVVLADVDNGLEKQFSRIYLAPNLGLISQEMTVLESQCVHLGGVSSPECINASWEEKAEKGYIMRRIRSLEE